MASSLRAFHVMLTPEQFNALQLKAARRQLSVSALLRELIDKDLERDRRAERRAAAKDD